MPDFRNYPIIAGVAQLTNRPRAIDECIEPLEMMARVARAAEEDSGAPGLLAAADSVQVVSILGWSYRDAPGMLAGLIGAGPSHRLYSGVGGDTPQRLVNETAQAIAEGRIRLAVIAGAESLESRRLARKLGEHPAWPPRGAPEHIDGDSRPGFSEVEARHGATLPVRMYPLFENAIRARLGHSIKEHQAHLGRLCARLSAVAAQNPYAWFPAARSAEEIATVSAANRMVCFPYPKLMNAIIQTDQAAAVIMTGSQTARELRIPEDRWVYLRGCGDAVDKWLVSERISYCSSPAIRAATRRALRMAGAEAGDIAFFDLYSCFPSAVQLALDALGLQADDPRPLTVTGGLPYAGGPGNNYVSHSIASAVQRLRKRPDDLALLTGLGWFATKHSAGVYSGRPPDGDWRRDDPKLDQQQLDAMESPPFVEEANGEAVVETYTVAFNREGDPEQAIVIGRLLAAGGEGARFFANTAPDTGLMLSMTREEFVGRRGRVCHDAATRRNIFAPA
jgi:acetyl-CoA C-acetyltransferase